MIVKSNQPREVFVAWDFDSFGPQRFVEGREMQPLGVDEGPVEIEYDRPNHASNYACHARLGLGSGRGQDRGDLTLALLVVE